MKIRIFLRLITLLLSILILSSCGATGPPNEVHFPRDVNGRTIGALNGSPSAQLAGELGNVVTFFDIDDMLNHLRVGTVDCIIMERLVADEIISGASGIRILSDPLLEYDLRFAVAKENKQLLDAIDEAIEALTALDITTSLPDISRAVGDENDEVQTAAIEALGEMGDETSLELLVDCSQVDKLHDAAVKSIYKILLKHIKQARSEDLEKISQIKVTTVLTMKNSLAGNVLKNEINPSKINDFAIAELQSRATH